MTQIQETKIHESINEELKELRKQLEAERMKKVQAVNKLAEIMARKEMSGKKTTKVSSTELKKREKECRRLQQELDQVNWLLK